MSAVKMHVDEVDSNEDLVRRLLRAQFPHWADLSIAPPLKTGTDNAIFRLGRDLSVRLPRRDSAVRQVHKEQEWLPRLAPGLPLRVPVPVAVGAPGEGYPYPWAIHPWFEGEAVTFASLPDPEYAARSLAHFTTALQALDAEGAPRTATGGTVRGAPLARLDEQVRDCLEQLGTLVDAPRVTAAWERALAAPVHARPPAWVHGDLAPGNLIARDGELVAVIDFGSLCVGDPACELLICWNLFRGDSRAAFREAAEVSDARWARGKGWALYWSLIAWPYYLETNRPIVELAEHVLREVLASE